MRQRFIGWNIFCVISGLILVLATVWLWRGELRPQPIVNEAATLPVVSERSKPPPWAGSRPKAGEQGARSAKVSSTSALPPQINLAVPFTSQAPEKNWDQPWQDACEEAAVLMLDAYQKGYQLSPLFAKDEILRMVAWEEEVKKWGPSITIEQIKELIMHYSATKKQVTIVENPTIEQLKKFVARGQPVLVVADGKVLPNPHYRSGGPVYHALIIRGYTEDKFITNDPGTQFGENFMYKYQDLMNAIHDWNNGSVKTGRRAVLVYD